jgi:hypothetical protein
MTGQIHKTIGLIIAEAKGDPASVSYMRTKLMLKGINPEKYGPDTEDEPYILDVVTTFLKKLQGNF